MKSARVLILLGCAALFLPAAIAQTVLTAELTGENEVPPVATNGNGTAVFTVYSDRIDFTLRASNLGTQVNAAHIHLGGPSVAGPVIVPLFNAGTGEPFSGVVSGTLGPADLVPNPDRGMVTWDDLVRALHAGRTYVNVHTTLVPAGEIRGQIGLRND